MAQRIIEMHRILKDTGSLYLHCDPTAAHYLKLLLDSIFGRQNFRNEMVWIYSRMASRKQKQLNKCHDTILWYSKSRREWTFNVDDICLPYAPTSKSRAGYKKIWVVAAPQAAFAN
jgi:site-specific DNA-methyltransferase (adenine-specific)